MEHLADIRRVLGHRDFRLLWLGQSASAIGDNIVPVAVALYVIARTHSPTDLSYVLGAQALTLVALLLVGGVWADRLPRHLVVVATDLVRFAAHALLAALVFAGLLGLWQLVAIEVLYRAAEAFFRPAVNGLLPQTVPERDIQSATAISAISVNVSEFAGPAIAALLVLGPGAGWAFALDAATFLFSAAMLLGVRPRPRARAALERVEAKPGETEPVEAERGEAERPASMWEEIREGAREVRARAWVWATLASFCAALFFGLASWFVLGPVVAREQYGNLGVYGYVEALTGAGALIGSIAGLRWRPRHPMRMAMLAMLIWPFVVVPYALGVTLVAVLPLNVLAGAGFALFDVWWLTALAERIPPRALSRVSSYDWMVSLALLPLGYLLMGPLAAQLGAVNVLVAGSVLAGLAFALGLLPRETRMLERREGQTPKLPAEEPLADYVHR